MIENSKLQNLVLAAKAVCENFDSNEGQKIWPELSDAVRQLETALSGVESTKNEICILWDIEDVHSIRPDLTDQQAWEVLLSAKLNHDADVGINWKTLELTAISLFGHPL